MPIEKRDDYVIHLAPRLAPDTPPDGLEAWLVANSSLPGRRANLELAWAIGDSFETVELDAARWSQLMGWLDISERQAPTGDPREFLPFCALQALGASYSRADDDRRALIVRSLKASATDGRWRIREGVAMGFQRIAGWDFRVLAAIVDGWMGDASLAERRAIIATLAHPPVLDHPEHVSFALVKTDEILRDLVALNRASRRTEGFRILKKGLMYAISVFAAHGPEPGFAFVRQWAQVDDADIRAILKANLKKARLAKRYQAEVQACLALL